MVIKGHLPKESIKKWHFEFHENYELIHIMSLQELAALARKVNLNIKS